MGHSQRTGIGLIRGRVVGQVRAVTVERVGDRVGLVPATLMDRIDEALRLHLDLG